MVNYYFIRGVGSEHLLKTKEKQTKTNPFAFTRELNNNKNNCHVLIEVKGTLQKIDESQGCVGNSSVNNKPGPVAKNRTPRPSGWESNPRPLDY